MQLPQWINNPWFVGVGGGVLSGLTVAWLSRLLFSKRDDREYAQKIAAVNREVVYSVRPGISEGNIPDVAILRALITATCRKYGVGEADVHDVYQLSQELIKEVMDSSFISSSTKTDFCTKLLALQQKTEPGLTVSVLAEDKSRTSSSVIETLRSRSRTQVSIMMGVMVTTTSLLLTFIREERTFGGQIVNPLTTVSMVLVASMVAMLVSLVARDAFSKVTKIELTKEISSKPTREGIPKPGEPS